MKLTFIGADHEVTGSCTHLDICGKHILVDYGMEQGKDFYQNASLPTLPGEIDAVLLTHAHMDHSGLIPLLYKNGFRGPVHATKPTCNLCDIMLRDSAHIQEFEAEWRNRKGARSGEEPFIPLYTMADAEGALKQFIPHRYDERFTLFEGIDVRFTDAGHLLGSSYIEIWIDEDGEQRKMVFSGDIGNANQPLLRDPSLVDEADYIMVESTYGDRVHDAPPDYARALADVLQATFDRGGSVIVPSFAVGRTQELLYFIRRIKADGLVHGHDGFPVFVDSPLASAATKIYLENAEFCYDAEAKSFVDAGINPLAFDGLTITQTSQESMAINTDTRCKVILSASGMCEAGRIKHHLKHGLWNAANTILFVGFQAPGTLGRALIEGADKVKLFGETIRVNAEIKQLPGISGHGDVNMLIKWATHFSPKPSRVFVNHGDTEVCDLFTKRLQDEFGLAATSPYSGSIYDLVKNQYVFEARPRQLVKDERDRAPERERATEEEERTERDVRYEPRPAHSERNQPQQKGRRGSSESPFEQLLSALDRLSHVIHSSKGRSKREIISITSMLNAISELWDRE
ncbi:MAG: MBL fold metallo-hydrolase [Christensenella sp.]|nr:MBL fold metallo-hydrolase [Christensenella sp.]